MDLTSAPIDISIFVPGGILATDHVHRKTNDRTCSRCRKRVPDEEVPLMFWLNGDDMLIYCGDCLDGKELAAKREVTKEMMKPEAKKT